MTGKKTRESSQKTKSLEGISESHGNREVPKDFCVDV
jgi:hypothetical protein